MSEVIEVEAVATTAPTIAPGSVAVVGATMPVPQQPSEAALISMIDRAARDPSVDIDKMQQLLALRQQIEDRQALRDWRDAMTQAQSEMRPVKKNMVNSQTRSKYASYDALDEAIRPIYTKYGFALSFDTGDSPLSDHVRVLCDVSRGGHSRGYHIDMPVDGKGAKGGDVMTKTHATGSGVSYGKRYLLGMIFNLATTDDDGNAAGKAAQVSSDLVTDEQIARLQHWIVQTGGKVDGYCKLMTRWAKRMNLDVEVACVPDTPAALFPIALGLMTEKAKKLGTALTEPEVKK